MRVEVPEFKRCCCCLPLRYGLLACAYIKLVIMLIMSIPIVYTIMLFSYIYLHLGVPHAEVTIVVFSIFLTLILLDISFTIVFLIGGHKKDVKLMKIFYIYNITVVCILTFVFVTSSILEFYTHVEQNASRDDSNYHNMILWANTKIVGVVNIGIDIYFILLIRSEIKKLANNCKFRFENTAAEAECRMEAEMFVNNDEHETKEVENYDQTNGTT